MHVLARECIRLVGGQGNNHIHWELEDGFPWVVEHFTSGESRSVFAVDRCGVMATQGSNHLLILSLLTISSPPVCSSMVGNLWVEF